MPSKIDPLITGDIYHIYNRGVDKRDIFQEKKDTLRFYNCLHLFNTEMATKNYRLASGPASTEDKLVSVVAYSLLPNHYHLILRQEKDKGIEEFMRRVATGYTSFFNQKYDRSGSLFQGRYKRKRIDSDEYYNYLFAYVNENFTVHGIASPADICYSSASHYESLVRSRLINEPPDEYCRFEAQQLAQEIYKKRLLTKSEVFE